MGITVGSRELPGRRLVTRDITIIIIIIIINRTTLLVIIKKQPCLLQTLKFQEINT
jgi:hypothetical protein